MNITKDNIISATLSDLPTIVHLAEEHNKIGSSSPFSLDKEFFIKYVTYSLSDDMFRVFLYKDIGMLYCLVSVFPWSSKKVVMDFSFFVKKGNPGVAEALLKKMEEWASSIGAEYCTMSIASGIKHKEVSRFFRRKGYKDFSNSFIKRLT